MKNKSEIESMAAALYAGGWRADDRTELIAEYNLTVEEADSICAVLVWYGQALA